MRRKIDTKRTKACYFFGRILRIRNNLTHPAKTDRHRRSGRACGWADFVPQGGSARCERFFVSKMQSRALKQPHFRMDFFVAFFVGPTAENTSVLPTNAVVFYGIFLDKDVDNF